MSDSDSSPEPAPAQRVTEILGRLRGGDASASDELLGIVYAELRGLARAIFADQRREHTLQPTALVHEAWIKLAGNLQPIADRGHFFVVAGKAMRQVITDHARGRSRQKRGGGIQRITLVEELDGAGVAAGIDLVELDDSLRELAKLNERHAQVAELRILSGLTVAEVAEALGVSRRSIDSDWAMAKAWLRTDLAER